jgi:hypothetical protein
MPTPLKNLEGYWDPGKTKLLNAHRMNDSVSIVVAQAPHRQITIMSPEENSNEWEIINLPMPYLYYFIRASRYYGQMTVQVAGIGCSLQFKDPRVDYLNILPLPNTGKDLYTCSLPFHINDDQFIRAFFAKENPKLVGPLVRELAKASICHYWQEGFHYHEQVSQAHKQLYSWAGAVGYVSNHSNVNLDVYKKWEKLKLADLNHQIWMFHRISKEITKLWMK